MLAVSSIRVLISGKPVLDDLSLTVGLNEIVGVIGAPGCGKSTLLHAIFGLTQVSAGRIILRGKDVANRSAKENIKDGIALVAQGGRVFRTLSVEENLFLGGYALGDRVVADRIAEVYEFFPRLKERREQIAGSLSGGERQMLALGIGLVPQPRMLLLDEPSAGLSPLLTERLLAEIKRLAWRLGCAVLIVEQNVKNAVTVSDRVLVLRRGRIAYAHFVTDSNDTGALLEAYAFKGSHNH
jgi:branched-chain amino acid transport system ATP-binding protein